MTLKRTKVYRMFHPKTSADRRVSVTYRELKKDGSLEALKAMAQMNSIVDNLFMNMDTDMFSCDKYST